MKVELRVGSRSRDLGTITDQDLDYVSEKLEDLFVSVRGYLPGEDYLSRAVKRGYAVLTDPSKDLRVKGCKLVCFSRGIKVRHKDELFEIIYSGRNF